MGVDIKLAEKQLSRAKIALMVAPNAVFFSHICLSVAHLFDETVKTACTNGLNIKYGPEFWDKCSPAEQIGLMLHEVLHIVFMHMDRVGDRDFGLFNMAADYVINLIIIEAGFKLPKGALYDKRFIGMSTEQVYDILEAEGVKPDPDFEDLVPGQLDDNDRRVMDDMLVQASIAAEVAGYSETGAIPDEVQKRIEELRNPQVPWFRIMRSFFTKLKKSWWTYRRPNRRFFPTDILPTRYSEDVCDFAVAVDASGSVQPPWFLEMVGEVMNGMKVLRPDKITFLQFTHVLGPVQEVTKKEDFYHMKFQATGGTVIDPVMKWAEENKPACLLVFTDGDYKPPTINPGCPVIWLVYNRPSFVAPFGKYIPFKFTGGK